MHLFLMDRKLKYIISTINIYLLVYCSNFALKTQATHLKVSNISISRKAKSNHYIIKVIIFFIIDYGNTV